jgi:hypothetical protein
MAVHGDTPPLVAQSVGDLTCEPDNLRNIADAVGSFAAMSPEERRRMGAAGRKFYEENLSLKAGVDRFEGLFAIICGPPVSASVRSGPAACAS